MQIIRGGLIWLGVTKKAKELHAIGLFELYLLHEDGSESLIDSDNLLNVALDSGGDIAIFVGHKVPTLEIMYNFMGHYGESLRKAYKPTKDFNYEQFLVAHFSNLMEQEL